MPVGSASKSICPLPGCFGGGGGGGVAGDPVPQVKREQVGQFADLANAVFNIPQTSLKGAGSWSIYRELPVLGNFLIDEGYHVKRASNHQESLKPSREPQTIKRASNHNNAKTVTFKSNFFTTQSHYQDPMETICMKWQSLFSRKKMKNILKWHLLNLPRVVKVTNQ